MTRLVFIHGRSQQGREHAAILQEWREAWARGLAAAGLSMPEAVDIALPFYGDVLDARQRGRQGLLSGAHAGAIGDDELAFKFQVLEEMAADQGIAPARINHHYRGVPRQRGPLNWEWVQALLRALDEHTGFGDDMLDRFTHDVYVYLKDREARAAVDAIVGAALRPGRSVVVGHSLGSIVGYNVLRAQGAGVDVARYVTLGSPLGIRAIQSLLDLPLAMPACVRSWYNALDERDVVALRPLDSRTFPVEPAIRNKTSVNNRTKNRHGISGYLDDPDVAKEIMHALSA